MLRALFLVLALAGCPMKPVYIGQLDVAVPRPVVLAKSDIPCYVVVEGPDDFVTEKGQTKPIAIHEVRTFVSRDVVQLFQNWFEHVEPMPASPPPGSHVVVRVSISGFGTGTTMSAAYAYSPTPMVMATSNTQGWLDWSVGLSSQGSSDLLFSMTDRSAGGQSISYVWQSSQLVDGILEGALVRLAQEYERSGAHQRVLGLGGGQGPG